MSRLTAALALSLLLTILIPTGASTDGPPMISSHAPTPSCQYSGLVVASGTCTQTYFVPSGIFNLRVTFQVPFLGSGNEQVIIKEQTPVIGDYVTFYSRFCSTLLYTSDASATCAGGQLRDWHNSVNHRFTGEVRTTCASAVHCSASVKATYS